MVDEQLAYASSLLKAAASRRADGAIGGRAAHGGTPVPWPKAVIVPHAGWAYSGTTAALAYALLAKGRGTIRRVVIVGPTHRVAVRGIAMSTAGTWQTPLGTIPVDVDAERAVLDMGTTRLIVNDPTHVSEHAVEVQVPFLQRTLGDGIAIVPLNAGDATADEVGDVLRALWGGPETVIVISSDLSHYHPQREARQLDDRTISRIGALDLPITPDVACGAYPINGLLDVIVRRNEDASSHGQRSGLRLELLGRSTSGDDGLVALAGESRPEMRAPDNRVVGYASWALWDDAAVLPERNAETSDDATSDTATSGTAASDAATSSSRPDAVQSARTASAPTARESIDAAAEAAGAADTLLRIARTAIAERLGLDVPDNESTVSFLAHHPWLAKPGASFVTLTQSGKLRGCIGSIIAHQSLGRDVAEHAVDAAFRDPRFMPVTAKEYPTLRIEVSVLSEATPIAASSRSALELALRPGVDGLIIKDTHGHAATFLPQVWDDLPNPHEFLAHLLVKAGLPADMNWEHGEIIARRYTVHAYSE